MPFVPNRIILIDSFSVAPSLSSPLKKTKRHRNIPIGPFHSSSFFFSFVCRETPLKISVDRFRCAHSECTSRLTVHHHWKTKGDRSRVNSGVGLCMHACMQPLCLSFPFVFSLPFIRLFHILSHSHSSSCDTPLWSPLRIVVRSAGEGRVTSSNPHWRPLFRFFLLFFLFFSSRLSRDSRGRWRSRRS